MNAVANVVAADVAALINQRGVAETARRVFREQAEALNRTADGLGPDFERAVQLIRSIKGRVIISGMGKSGIIGRKIAATLASTGTPAFFVHPGEAYHGDLGMITRDDIALLLSYSGETEEVIRLIPSLRSFGVPIIAIAGKSQSTLARNANVFLDVHVDRETCPHNLAPTTSTTATLVMGDALAVSLMQLKNFRPQDFAVFHPGGSLGRRLLTRVSDVMHRHYPVNHPNDGIREIITAITRGRLGLTIVMEDGVLQGIITDGDLRRAIYANTDFSDLTAADFMSRSPLTIADSEMFAEAEVIMNKAKVNSLLVTDASRQIMGVLKIFDAMAS